MGGVKRDNGLFCMATKSCINTLYSVATKLTIPKSDDTHDTK